MQYIVFYYCYIQSTACSTLYFIIVTYTVLHAVHCILLLLHTEYCMQYIVFYYCYIQSNACSTLYFIIVLVLYFTYRVLHAVHCILLLLHTEYCMQYIVFYYCYIHSTACSTLYFIIVTYTVLHALTCFLQACLRALVSSSSQGPGLTSVELSLGASSRGSSVNSLYS